MCGGLNQTVEINQGLSRSFWILRESDTRGICSEFKSTRDKAGDQNRQQYHDYIENWAETWQSNRQRPAHRCENTKNNRSNCEVFNSVEFLAMRKFVSNDEVEFRAV